MTKSFRYKITIDRKFIPVTTINQRLGCSKDYNLKWRGVCDAHKSLVVYASNKKEALRQIKTLSNKWMEDNINLVL